LQNARAEKEAEQKYVQRQRAKLYRQLCNRQIRLEKTHGPKLESEIDEGCFSRRCKPEIAGSAYELRKLSGLDEELNDLKNQINDLDRQHQAQIYGLPGYERFLTGKLTSPGQTVRSTAKGFKGWIARKWYR
jgi:hypothetical protein